MRTTQQQVRGITIIDVLISVVVMGIVASLVIPNLMTATRLNQEGKEHEDHHAMIHSENEIHSNMKVQMKTENAPKTVSLSSSDKNSPILDDL